MAVDDDPRFHVVSCCPQRFPRKRAVLAKIITAGFHHTSFRCSFPKPTRRTQNFATRKWSKECFVPPRSRLGASDVHVQPRTCISLESSFKLTAMCCHPHRTLVLAQEASGPGPPIEALGQGLHPTRGGVPQKDRANGRTMMQHRKQQTAARA